MKRSSLFLSFLGLSLLAATSQAQEELFPGRVGEVVRGEVELGSLGKQVVEYTVIDGYRIFQGDIVLSAPPSNAGAEEGRGIAPRSAVRTQAQFQWPRGIVPFTVDDGFSGTMRTRIQHAVDYWNNLSLIQLVPRSNERDWVLFTPGSGCASAVGRQSGLQRIFLNNCSTGSIIHEIGHAVGLFHENMRADRDLNVTVRWGNIIPGAEGNFFTYSELGQDGADFGAFDFDSIMMYGSFFFSRNGQPTLTRKDGTTFVAQRANLSAGDLAGVRQMYYALAFDGWSDVPALSTVLPRFSPALTSWGQGHLAMFMVGEDEQMHVAGFDGANWSGWQPLGGIFTSGPAAASRGPGLLDVVGKGLDNRFWINSFDGSGWSGWSPILDGEFLFGPAVAVPGSNLMDVFGTGFDNQLWVNSLQNGAWTGWSPLGGGINEAPGAARGCFFICWSGVAVRGWNNKIFTGIRLPGQWTGFTQIPGDQTFTTAPAEVERAVVLAVGNDGQIYVTNSDNGPWTSWKPLRGMFFSNFAPSGARWPSGKIHVVGIGTDFRFKINTYDRGPS